MRPLQRITRHLAVCLLLLIAAALPCHAASDWDAPAADLARQIASLTGPGTITLILQNKSSIASDDLPAIRKLLLNDLTALGITVRVTDAATAIRITLSQNAQHGLWVAEVQQGPETRVAIVALPSSASTTKPQPSPLLLRKTLLITQDDPILDAQLISLPAEPNAPTTTQHLIVLTPDHLTLYHSDPATSGAWTKDRAFDIPHTRPYAREIRGHLELDTKGFSAYLPGVICTSAQSAGLETLALTCADSDDPWPLGSHKAFYNSSRNYFTGLLVPSEPSAPQPFYSTAELLQKRGPATVYSEVSGQVRVSTNGTLRPLAGTRDWGSDLAAVNSGCGSGAQLLASAAGDPAAQDSLIAYELDGRDAIPVSPPLAFEGQIVALWPMPSSQPAAVLAILRTPQPTAYEAYRVTVVCTQ